MRFLRSCARVARAAVFLTAWTLRQGARRPDPGSDRYEAWRREYFTGACQGILHRLGVEIEVDGEFPRGGGVLVTNHLGYLDVFVLASLGPTIFVSRADVEHWPLVGRLTRWCSTIYIDRQRRDQIPRVLAEMEAAGRTGAQVIFFPEATSGPGDGLLPFRPSLFAAPAAGDLPVRTAALRYATGPDDPPARDTVSWWGDDGFSSHFFRLAGLKEVHAHVRFSSRIFRSPDRKELARQCEEEIGRALSEADADVAGAER